MRSLLSIDSKTRLPKKKGRGKCPTCAHRPGHPVHIPKKSINK